MSESDQKEKKDTLPFTCRDCRHYYVTWDRSFPHGCRAIGFKSKNSPALRVKEASGMICQLFVKREPRQD